MPAHTKHGTALLTSHALMIFERFGDSERNGAFVSHYSMLLATVSCLGTSPLSVIDYAVGCFFNGQASSNFSSDELGEGGFKRSIKWFKKWLEEQGHDSAVSGRALYQNCSLLHYLLVQHTPPCRPRIAALPWWCTAYGSQQQHVKTSVRNLNIGGRRATVVSSRRAASRL